MQVLNVFNIPAVGKICLDNDFINLSAQRNIIDITGAEVILQSLEQCGNRNFVCLELGPVDVQVNMRRIGGKS